MVNVRGYTERINGVNAESGVARNLKGWKVINCKKS